MATESLTGAIKDAFNANATLTTYFTGGIALDEEPETQTLPWVIQSIEEGGEVQWDSGGYGIEMVPVKFEVYGSTAATAETGAISLAGVFDAVPPVISFTTSLMMSFLRQTALIDKVESVRTASGEVAAVTEIKYMAMVQRSR